MPDARLRRTRALYDARPDPGPLTDAELVAVFHERYVIPLSTPLPWRPLHENAAERLGAPLDEQ